MPPTNIAPPQLDYSGNLPLASRNGPHRFTIDGTSYLCGEQCFAAGNSRLFGDHPALQTIIRVSDPKLNKQYGRNISDFDSTVLEHARENIVLVGSYVRFAQTPAMRQHLLDTGDRRLEEDSPLRRLGYTTAYRYTLKTTAYGAANGTADFYLGYRYLRPRTTAACAAVWRHPKENASASYVREAPLLMAPRVNV